MKRLLVTALAVITLAACGGSTADPTSTAPTETSPATPVKAPEGTDIWKASGEGAVDTVAQFLESGSDINGTFDLPGVPGTGGTPLHIACLAHQNEVVALLIERGADVNRKAVAPDQQGGTPMHWAAVTGNAEGIKLLLEAGANVNAPDNSGATPLSASLFDLGTVSMLDYGSLPAEKKAAYDTIYEAGGRQ